MHPGCLAILSQDGTLEEQTQLISVSGVMMAASKPTGIHYALIIFVMLTLTFGVMAFMFGKQNTELKALRDQADKKAGELATARTTLDSQLKTLKDLLGHTQDQVVDPGNQDSPSSVVGALRADLALAGEPAQATLTAAMHTMAEKIRNLTAERDARKRELDIANASLLALNNEYQKKVDEESQARTSAETTLQDRIQSIDDDLKVKDDMIASLEKEKSELAALLDTEIAAHQTDVRDLGNSVSNFKAVAADLQTELEKTKQISFEIADGLVVSVDNLTKTAYVNLGRDDGLPLRTSFSVYTKANRGVARGKEDIKGAVEVTQHLGPHLSIVRILEDDIYDPIAPGDPIYTPMWHTGQKNSFSIVGAIDLDGDGQSDRELFRELVAASGAKIDNEVDDEGKLHGDGITIKTRFLIIADIPSDAPSAPSEKAKYLELKENQLKLTDQARERGIRVVTLDNFLNFIGYRPSFSVYKPGVERKSSVLKSGAVSKRPDGTDTSKAAPPGTELKGMDRRDKPKVKEIQIPGQRTFIK